MATVPEDTSHLCYDIKSADLPMLALLLKTTDMLALSLSLNKHLSDSPNFFNQELVIVDVSALQLENSHSLDLEALLVVLREHQLVPLALKGADKSLLAKGKGLGLVDALDARIKRSVAVARPSETLTTADEAVSSIKTPALAFPLGAMVIDKPLRSGQQVYAKGRDLVVMAMVNAGAEVIADGHIHVYGALRGKAIAGARGNTQAHIFAQVMEPELISIAGVYRTSENALAKDVLGQAAQVSLQSGPDGDKLLIKPLKA